MYVSSVLGLATTALLLGACSPAGEPTQLSIPEGALDVRRGAFEGGRMHQTDFTLKVTYPNDGVVDHYIKTIPEPWVRCDWGPTWDNHLDGTLTPVHTIHQQAHFWINRDARRALLLSVRYYSASDCAPRPLNDDQKVVVLEYIGVDVDDHVKTLQLKCPAQVRSNSTLRSDAREVPSAAKSCGARAGERGR